MSQTAGIQLVTKRLILRPFTVEDAPDVSRLCNNYELYKTTLSLPYPYTVSSAQQWISGHADHFSEGSAYEFAITDKESGRLIGCVGLSHNQAHRHGELGYWIDQDHWGQGVASEAAEAVVRFAFDVKGYHRVFARHFASNPASGRVMQKIGMAYEGLQIGHIYKDGVCHDIALYGIINPRETA